MDKGFVRWEIHKVGCSDSYRNDPIQVCELEADNSEDLIRKDIGEEYDFKSHRECYQIAPCLKKAIKLKGRKIK